MATVTPEEGLPVTDGTPTAIVGVLDNHATICLGLCVSSQYPGIQNQLQLASGYCQAQPKLQIHCAPNMWLELHYMGLK